MVVRKKLLGLSLVLVLVYLLSKELIFVDSSSFFLAIMSFLSLWFIYELGIKAFEEVLVSQAEVVLKQFDQASEVERKVLNFLLESNEDRKNLSSEILNQVLSSLRELSSAIQINFEGLGNFFDICVQEYLQFLCRELVELKLFLYKISLYSLGQFKV